MRLLFVFSITAFMAVTKQEVGVSYQITNEILETLQKWKEVANPHITECMCQTGVKQDIIDGFFDRGEFPNDSCFKCTIRCVAEKLGLISSSGKVNLEKVLGYNFGVRRDLLLQCKQIQNTDICQKVYEILKCSYTAVLIQNGQLIVADNY